MDQVSHSTSNKRVKFPKKVTFFFLSSLLLLLFYTGFTHLRFFFLQFFDHCATIKINQSSAQPRKLRSGMVHIFFSSA